MLFKLSGPDMLNTSLVDVATGHQAYNIATILSSPTNIIQESLSQPQPPSLSSSFTESSTNSSASFLKKSTPALSPEDLKGAKRHTTITDATGNVVASIKWKGRRPDITIGDEQVGALTDLFGSSTVRFMPKILAIPTRFDTEYVWTATADSLKLFDYDTDNVKGSFHQNVMRLPAKAPKTKLSSPSKFRLTLSSTYFSGPLSPSKPSVHSISEQTDCTSMTLNPGESTFIPTHLPGLGSCYLEFSSHPLAKDIEIILSFLMMEILRRGRFSLTPYTFEKPRLWQFKEARDLFMRRLRRNTV